MWRTPQLWRSKFKCRKHSLFHVSKALLQLDDFQNITLRSTCDTHHSCGDLHSSVASTVYSTCPRHCYSWMTFKTSHSCGDLHSSVASTVYSTCPTHCYNWMTFKTSHSCGDLHSSVESIVKNVMNVLPASCYWYQIIIHRWWVFCNSKSLMFTPPSALGHLQMDHCGPRRFSAYSLNLPSTATSSSLFQDIKTIWRRSLTVNGPCTMTSRSLTGINLRIFHSSVSILWKKPKCSTVFSINSFSLSKFSTFAPIVKALSQRNSWQNM